MKAFISYARRDAALVRELAGDLARLRQTVWFDGELEGGQQWWDVILDEVRSCDLFVVALSNGWVRSGPCRAEFEYAVALGRPLLPLMVNDVDVASLPERLARTEFIDYRRRSPEAVMDLSTALALVTPVALPEAMPPPPAAPVSSLAPLADQAGAPSLSGEEQLELLRCLRREAERGDLDASVRAVVVRLRERSDVTMEAVRQSDGLLAKLAREADGDDEGSGAGSLSSRGTPEGLDLVRSLARHLDNGKCTPILGLGTANALVGSRRSLARAWAQSFEYPTPPASQDDLPQVAQFVSVMRDRETLRDSLVDYLRDRMRRLYGDAVPFGPGASLDEMLVAAWEHHATGDPADPHMVLASKPCPVYLTAQPAELLAAALRAQGKDPVVEVCRWRDDDDGWPESNFGRGASYSPSVERPLVYHVFGSLAWPETLVLTEDDYFEFLTGITQHRDLVPDTVREALANSALMLLGFGLEDWDTRVLLRSLVSQAGSHKARRYKHGAAQIDTSSSTSNPERARSYLKTYFKYREPAMDIYWGSVADFCADLRFVQDERRGDN